jgi:hypothetical protein
MELMMKRAFALVAVVVAVGWAGADVIVRAQQAPSQTWTGMISDSTCGGEHGSEVDVKECTQKCIKNGDKYVLATENGVKVIPIANQDFAGLPKNAGDIVKVTGQLKNGAIVISKIEQP